MKKVCSQKFLLPFKGYAPVSPPVWVMRQAGRYLPEYRKIRKNFSSFLDFCLHPEAVCEVTLQPIQRFGFDAAILFSDILLLPALLGQSVVFKEKEGPCLGPLEMGLENLGLSAKNLKEEIEPVLRALRLIRSSLPTTTVLIGFAGAPWTVAAYMLEGKTSKDFSKAKAFAFKHPDLFHFLLNFLVENTILFLDHQIQAGADLIQIFESWAGAVPGPFFREWVIRPTEKIIAALKEKHPHVPVIAFPKGIGVWAETYIQETRTDGFSLDFSFPLEQALSFPAVLQGNLDPSLLVAGGEPLHKATRSILEIMRGKPFIFNLGHGILPETPIDHVQQLLDDVRSFV